MVYFAAIMTPVLAVNISRSLTITASLSIERTEIDSGSSKSNSKVNILGLNLIVLQVKFTSASLLVFTLKESVRLLIKLRFPMDLIS